MSGSYAGASLEEKLSTEVHTGFSKEEGKDTEESETDAETVAIEFDCKPGGIKLLEVSKDHKRELIPTKGLFILDFSIKLVFYDWWQKAPGTKFRPTHTREFNVSSVEGLLQFAQGVDTNYPTMEGFWNDRSTPQSLRDSLLRLNDPANRSYTLDADKMRVLENNATYKVTDLETIGVHGLEVVDLSDEQNRNQYTGSLISCRMHGGSWEAHFTSPSGFIDAEIIEARLESIEAALERIEEKLGGRSEIPEEASSN